MKVTVHVDVENGKPPRVQTKVEPAPQETVACNDGSVSPSGGRPGACAWHGGVKKGAQ